MREQIFEINHFNGDASHPGLKDMGKILKASPTLQCSTCPLSLSRESGENTRVANSTVSLERERRTVQYSTVQYCM
jgi:hypothetical protein